MSMLRKYWGLLLVSVLSFWAVQPLFMQGFFPMHDDTQVVRVSQMAQAISDGHFPVRWVKDLGYGYGYPIFNFYAPLAYYFGGIINLLGVDPLESTKAMMAIGTLLAGVFMYVLARAFWGELGGIVAALFYMYAPYHAVDIYVRGAVGEFWAYAFLPLLAFGLYRRHPVTGALGFAGVVLSHNLTALMLVPFLIITLLLCFFDAYQKQQLYAIRYTLYALLLGLGLSAFYWLPALLELGYTNIESQIGGGADFRNHFVCWQQLWESQWGFGGSASGCIDGLSLKIGKLHVLISLVALIGAFFFWKKHKQQSSIILIVSVQLLVAILLTLEVSRPIWEAIGPLAYLQYPWRFLLLASFFASLLAGSIVWFAQRFSKVSFFAATMLLALLFFGNVKLFQPHYTEGKSVSDFVSEHSIKWTTSRISDEYMPRYFVKPENSTGVVQRRVSVGKVIVDKTDELVFETNESGEKTILISIAPFPAWKAFIDSTPASYRTRSNGIELAVLQGVHRVKLSYVSTVPELLGNSISVVGILILVGGILKNLWKR